MNAESEPRIAGYSYQACCCDSSRLAVTSGVDGMVLIGGELTLFQAVDPVGV
jgi:hypothetical protein